MTNEKISDAELLKMTDAELREHGFMRRFDGTICHLPTSLAPVASAHTPPTTPPESARERLAAAAAEMKHLRNAAAAEFRAAIDRIGKRMGFDIVAEPRMIRTRGVFSLGAELVIVERTESDRSDIDGDDV